MRDVRELPDFTVRYNALLEASANPNTRSGTTAYSQRSLQRRLNDLGWAVSAGQLAALATGKTRSPGGALLLAVAQGLEVSPLAWFDHATFQNELNRLRYRKDHLLGMELVTESSAESPPGAR